MRLSLVATALALAATPALADPAATGGSSPELMHIYDLYESGDYESADPLLQPLLDSGDLDAQGLEGILYLLGIGRIQDGERAHELCLASAEAHMPMGLHCMGHLYESGTASVDIDHQLAALWWSRGIEHGDLESMYHLAESHIAGTGVPNDPEEAVRLLRQAAERGEKYSAHTLGVLHGSVGSIVGWDPELRYKYFRQVIGTVAADPMVRLWVGAYELDQAADQDAADAALALIEAEALDGYPPAMLRVAYLCLTGTWQDQDLACARQWYARTEDYEIVAPGVYMIGQLGLALVNLLS